MVIDFVNGINDDDIVIEPVGLWTAAGAVLTIIITSVVATIIMSTRERPVHPHHLLNIICPVAFAM